MNAHGNNAQVDALSDNELDAVSGGKHQQTSEDMIQYLLRLVEAGVIGPSKPKAPLF